MKAIFPSFAQFALTAAIAYGQSDGRPPAMSIAPPDAAVNPSGSAMVQPGFNAGAPAAAQSYPASTTNSGTVQNNGAPPDGADLFIQRAAATVGSLQSVQARIRYRANLFGPQTVGAGTYLQQGLGDDRQFRLELKTAVGQQLLTFQQVCDGRFLWQYRDSFNKQSADMPSPNVPGDGKPSADKPDSDPADRPTIARIDLTKVRQTLQDADRKPNFNAVGPLTFGGLPKLLDGLQKSFRFSRVEAGKLETMPVWLAVGSWTPEALEPIAKELADQAAHEQPLNLKLLPPQLPEQVWLYLGQDDLFPYRIEYRRRRGSQSRAGGAEEMVPVVTVEFYEVRLNAQINPHEFDYQPASADILDTTATFLKELQGK